MSDTINDTTQSAVNADCPQSECSTKYVLEGLMGRDVREWRVIERRSSLELILRDKSDYESWIDESGWHDFRISKEITRRETLK